MYLLQISDRPTFDKIYMYTTIYLLEDRSLHRITHYN